MELNFMAMLAAAIVPMVVGFIWYNEKVFGNAWMQATGMTPEKAKGANMAVVFGLTFVFSLMIAFIMNLIAYHDAFVNGATFYATNGQDPAPGSEAAKWLEQYKANYSDAHRNFKHGSFHALLMAGLFLALPIIGVNSLFERRGFKFIAINAGYWIVCLTIMGGIIAAWK